MRKPGCWFTLIALYLTLAGCGGSSNPLPSAGVTVSPANAQVLAGATQQFTASANDGGTTFTWQVNGTRGGSASPGTISTVGLYAAPAQPPAGGRVTITAIEQGGAGASGSATLSIAFSNASLAGGYVFSLRGLSQGAPWYAIGEFTANGAGQVQNGLEDINNGSATQVKTAFTGNYAINPDGSGTLTLGNLDLRLVLQANGGAQVLGNTTASALTGSLTVQSSTAGSVSNLVAPLVLDANGQAANQGYAQLALIDTAGSSALAGYEDVSGATSMQRLPWTGSYAFDSNGHGRLSIQDSTGSHAYSFYAISATDFALLSTDPARTAIGSIQSQAALSYSNATLNGPYTFMLDGASATQPYAQAGQFNPGGNGNLGTVTEDLNMPGNILTGIITAGTYTMDAAVSGRGTLTLSNPGSAPQNFVFYMLAPQVAELMTTNSTFVASGRLQQQTANLAFNNSLLIGAYSFLCSIASGTANLSALLATLDLDGNGKLSGTGFENDNGSLPPTLALSGSYALSGAVRGTATLVSNGGSSSPFALYPLSSSDFILIGTSAADPCLGSATLRN
ncbi:MAG: hypothetical protein ACRETQ_12840 [Gammaproteobacteria bacterium]